jgi:hypothetical protein
MRAWERAIHRAIFGVVLVVLWCDVTRRYNVVWREQET